MAFRRTRLDNGVTLVTDDMAGVRSVTLGFWFGVGSRDERPEEAGLTHFMEHMMFKGTPRLTAVEISELFDMLGAESNAFTSKEYTCYHARFVDDRLDEVLAVLTDMVLHSTFRDEDIEPEREVVLEEIAQSLDQPDDHVFEMFSSEMWPSHPLGRPVLGSSEIVSGFRHAQCRRFHERHYTAPNLVVAAAGNLDHDDLAEKLSERLGGMPGGAPGERHDGAEMRRGRLAVQCRETEQAHLVYGVPSYAAGDEDRFAGSLMAAILGGSASSRLFQEVREKRGLAYSVFSGASAYQDMGQFYVYCGTRPDNLGWAAAIVRREMERMGVELVSPEELKRSCEVICAQILMGMESTSERMIRIGRRETMGLEQVSPEDLIRRYRAVSPGDIRSVAEKYLSASPTAAVVSPFGADEAHALVFSS